MNKRKKLIVFSGIVIIAILLVISAISFSVYRNKYVIFKDNFIEFSARVNLHESGGILRTDAERLQLFIMYDETMQNQTTLEDLKNFPNIVMLGTMSSTYFDTEEERAEFEKTHSISRREYEKYAGQLQEVLPDLEKLKAIVLCPETIILDMSPFMRADQVEELRINTNQIEDLTGIGEMESLRILDVSNNKITDIKALKELNNLEALDISQNNIENIDILLELPQLKVLSYKTDDKEQEKILDKLRDKGCVAIQNSSAFLDTIDEKGIKRVDFRSLDNY